MPNAVAADVSIGGWSPPTAVPFSCAPMPNALFLPRPGADVPGAYARCASFADARAISVAVSRDGRRAALIGIDGIARIIDLASRLVIGLLAPPRGSVDLAAFSPDGNSIVTLSRGERVVTIWQADSFTPFWTTSLAGHTYSNEYMGVLAYSPDESAVLVSPGEGLYLLDPATGAVRASNSQLSGAVLNAAYGWQGQRIAVLTAPVTGMCVYSPHGGTVTTLDPKTLAPLATPMIWPAQGDEGPGPGQLLVAADADLIVTSGLETDAHPAARAFRLSDGSPLPAPALPGPPPATFPLALSPDGTAALMSSAGSLQLVRLADGVTIASTTAAAPTAVAFSGDGLTIAAGSRGDDLLGIWRPAAGPMRPTCAAVVGAADQDFIQTSLSADGSTLAIEWGPELRIVRRADGSTISTIDRADQTIWGLQISPDGKYVLAEFADEHSSNPTLGFQFPLAVYRTSDGAEVADLGDEHSFQGGSWGSFAFLPDGLRLDGVLGHQGAKTDVMEIDLQTGTVSPKLTASQWDYVVGMSGDCPLLVDANMTLVRACGGCQPLPLATNVMDGVASLDGTRYLGQDGDGPSASAILWAIEASPGVLQTYPARPEESTWQPSEMPVAISAHGDRVITSARQNAPCSAAPGFTSRVHDVATNTIVDELPPGFSSASADLAVLAFGPVVWCAR